MCYGSLKTEVVGFCCAQIFLLVLEIVSMKILPLFFWVHVGHGLNLSHSQTQIKFRAGGQTVKSPRLDRGVLRVRLPLRAPNTEGARCVDGS